MGSMDAKNEFHSRIFGDQQLLIGGENYISWLAEMKTYCLLKGKGVWNFISGDGQKELLGKKLGNRLSQDDFLEKLNAENGLALGYIRASVHVSLDNMICDARSPLEAMQIIRTHCDQEVLRNGTVLMQSFSAVKLDLGKGAQAFLTEFDNLESTLRRVGMDQTELFKKTTLINGLPACMEAERGALERLSSKVSLKELKNEIAVSVQQFVRRNGIHGGKNNVGSSSTPQPQGSAGLSEQNQALSADFQDEVEESGRRGQAIANT